ncbi:MAG TPA: hypothetical protein VM925_31785 [Labilithrix sp.]|nr:hypothetical protein [Labilithrix sp.]
MSEIETSPNGADGTETSELPRRFDPLDPANFAPPYVLAGSAFIVVGLWGGDAPIAVPGAFSPIRLLGRQVGIIVGSSFEHPPRELPIRYHEVIAAIVVRRGLSVLSLPFDMLLDEPTPVALGRLHYGLPKRLDPEMSFQMDASHIAANGVDTSITAHASGPAGNMLALPLRLAFTLGVRLLTRRIQVLGTADGAPRHARIALTPKGLGASFPKVSAVVGGRELKAMWCQSWSFSSTLLGPPRALDDIS